MHKFISQKIINLHLILSIFLLFATIAIFHFTNLDLQFQKLFFQNNKWLIDKNHPELKLLFYIIPRTITQITALSAMLVFLYAKYTNKEELWRKALVIFLSILVMTLLVGFIKQLTNMHCPEAILEFGGDKPYIKLLQEFPYPLEKRGKCFPAGHASGFFSLIAFAYLINNRFTSIITYLIIVTIGLITGGYQIMKGVHYLSETIISLLLAHFITCIIIKKILKS